MLTWLIESDKALFELINGHGHSPWLDALMAFWRDKHSWIPLYIVLAGILFWKYRWNAIPLLILTAITILVVDQLSSELIKKTVMRLRPCNDPDMQTSLKLLVHCGSGYSFTSSHAANHFALAYLFIRFSIPILPKNKPKIRWIILFSFLLWAVLVALAQVYVGVHYPLDVFCGAALGLSMAILLYYIFQRLWKKTILR